MAKAESHPRQSERLHTLRSYEILDTDPERDFDEIVALAAALCGTPISVINFIDEDRQWFKAETGLGVRQTPLETSLCSHAILEEEFLEVPDTRDDARMCDNPLCLGDEGLRFYAGALLKTSDGLPLGTLCVLDRTPRSLTPLQRDTLRVLADQIMARLEMRRSLATAALLRQEVDHRVKNSLQSLASLIRIANRGAVADETRRTLSTLGSRVDAVAKLHEELYRTDAGPVIDLAHYVENLGRHFRALAPAHLNLDVISEPILVTSGQAVAVGTLLNEFVANSLKHAFPGSRAGHVRISIDRGDDDTVRIRCSDDGVGFPTSAANATSGLGMQINDVISEELQGRIEISSDSDGTVLTLSFEALPTAVARSA
ncbi:GAF domain-containing protein [Silicimonas algicola]|uniref:Two-component sensor histidine kinase n=1 Tax=Silicimonas algicola TaxID=1826607 RepID=A0A316GSD0_9RHOB|nr:histidine kinase dimerization/phosphoacceptor domain -containing protein [Silicimonas algicola]AZQ67670.1 GAF domain-containing protein [Silicimonas algicola]PWK57927.1 two-component sensor histidine kinase [Silicimonas algicola]